MKIYLDVDDVLNKFTEHTLQRLGCSGMFPVECGYNIVAAANATHPTTTFTEDSFWQSLDRSVWADAPKSDEFYFILDWACTVVGMENICLLTSVLHTDNIEPNVECIAGKLQWIKRNIPRAMQQQYFIGPSKHLCAELNALLIDDCALNVKNFVGAGGQGILVPRPWNPLHHLDTMDYLEEQFNGAI